MVRIRMRNIIKTAIISAFTFAAALIWKDVIIDAIEVIFPTGEELFYKFLAATFATLIAILAIYLILETEEEAEGVIRKLKHKDKKRRKYLKRNIKYID